MKFQYPILVLKFNVIRDATQWNYIPIMQRSLEFHVSRGTLRAEIKRQKKSIYIYIYRN